MTIFIFKHFIKSVAFCSTFLSVGVVERNGIMFLSLRNKLSILIDVIFNHCLLTHHIHVLQVTTWENRRNLILTEQ